MNFNKNDPKNGTETTGGMTMGNLAAAIAEIKDGLRCDDFTTFPFRAEVNEKVAEVLIDAFRAYDGDTFNAEECRESVGKAIEEKLYPKFKVDEWVMHEDYDNLFRVDAVMPVPDYCPFIKPHPWPGAKDSDLEGFYAEVGIRHATDAEKFRKGALARYEVEEYSATGRVWYDLTDIDKGEITIQMGPDADVLCVDVKDCTLIEPAPQE